MNVKFLNRVSRNKLFPFQGLLMITFSGLIRIKKKKKHTAH